MSKKPDTAAALAGILKAKRGDDRPQATDSFGASSAVAVTPLTPSPAPQPASGAATKGRGGKSSDKANYSQYSVYLRRDTRKKVGRALDDAETGQDFSELVQELLEQWFASRT